MKQRWALESAHCISNMKHLVSPVHDPYLNIAVERYLFDHYSGEELVLLWVNNPCVVIGRNQNAWLETDHTALKEEQAVLCRRYTGGGAVWQDRGNLNYTWITEENSPERIIRMIQDTLQSFGIPALRNERNDLLIGDRKFSGTASLMDEGVHLYHGTLMIDVDLDRLERVLTPSVLKMQSHGIDSVRSRVMNLNTLSRELTVEGMIQRFLQLFPSEEIPWPGEEAQDLRSVLASEKWLLEQSPKFDVLLEYRIHGSLYSVSADVHSGRIEQVSVSTDDLRPVDTSALEEQLTGMLFDEDTIRRKIKETVH